MLLIKVRISFCPVFKKMIKIMNDNSSVYFHALFTCLLTCSLSTFKVCATLRCKLISLVFVIKFMMFWTVKGNLYFLYISSYLNIHISSSTCIDAAHNKNVQALAIPLSHLSCDPVSSDLHRKVNLFPFK